MWQKYENMIREFFNKALVVTTLTGAVEGDLPPKTIAGENDTKASHSEKIGSAAENFVGYIDHAHEKGLKTENMESLMNLIGMLSDHRLEFSEQLYEELIDEAIKNKYESTAVAFGYKYMPEALKTEPSRVDTSGLEKMRALPKNKPMPTDTTHAGSSQKRPKILMPPPKFMQQKH
jgi:hypothetical protein